MDSNQFFTSKHDAIGNIFLVSHADDIVEVDEQIQLLLETGEASGDVEGVVAVLVDGRQPGLSVYDARIFNIDGSEAEISGNGLLCLGAGLGMCYPDIAHYCVQLKRNREVISIKKKGKGTIY